VLSAIDTVWDVVDLYNDARDCLGDSDSMACYMAAAGVAFIAMGALEGPSNNVARRAAKAADVGDAAGDVARRVDAGDAAILRSVTYGNQRLFYDGARQQRALAIAQEAAQAAGVRLSDYVDDVVYTTGRAPFFGVVNDRRVLALNQATLRKTRAGQLIDSVHELSHARHSARFGYQNYRSLYFSSLSMRARIEILVESRAQRTVERYLGGLSPQQRGWTSRYLNWWGQYYP